MKRIHLLPNVITAFSLACGLFIIFRMSLLPPGAATYPVLRAAVLLLLTAAIADVLDGATARLIRAESEFGEMFDSLSDAITFGVAPAVITLKSFNLAIDDELSIIASIAAMLFAICGVLRLVRFTVGLKTNLDLKKKRIGRKLARYYVFQGLPIPAAAVAIASATLLLSSSRVKASLSIGETQHVLILTSLLILLSYLMISRWHFPGIKALHVRLWPSHLILLTVGLTLVLFYGLLHHFAIVFVTLSWGYIVATWILSLVYAIQKKRNQP